MMKEGVMELMSSRWGHDRTKGKELLHGTAVVSTWWIYDGVDSHVDTWQPRNGIHIRARTLAVIMPITRAVPGRTTAGAAHTARIGVVMTAQARVGIRGVAVGRCAVLLRGIAAGMTTGRGGSSVGRRHASEVVVRVHVVDGCKAFDSTDPAIVVVGVIGR